MLPIIVEKNEYATTIFLCIRTISLNFAAKVFCTKYPTNRCCQYFNKLKNFRYTIMQYLNIVGIPEYLLYLMIT